MRRARLSDRRHDGLEWQRVDRANKVPLVRTRVLVRASQNAIENETDKVIDVGLSGNRIHSAAKMRQEWGWAARRTK